MGLRRNNPNVKQATPVLKARAASSLSSAFQSLLTHDYSTTNRAQRTTRFRFSEKLKVECAKHVVSSHICAIPKENPESGEQHQAYDAILAHRQCDLHIARCLYINATAKTLESAELPTVVRADHPNRTIGLNASAASDMLIEVHVFSSAKQSVQQEILVLASQPISALCGAISCSRIVETTQEINCSPTLVIGQKFYMNMVDDRAKESVIDVLQWLNCRQERAGSVESSTTPFKDISISLGERYLFVHGGNCEHLLMFVDMRASSSAVGSSFFPMCLRREKSRVSKCLICKTYQARTASIEDKLCSSNPTILCTYCLHMLHYTPGDSLRSHGLKLLSWNQ